MVVAMRTALGVSRAVCVVSRAISSLCDTQAVGQCDAVGR